MDNQKKHVGNILVFMLVLVLTAVFTVNAQQISPIYSIDNAELSNVIEQTEKLPEQRYMIMFNDFVNEQLLLTYNLTVVYQSENVPMVIVIARPENILQIIGHDEIEFIEKDKQFHIQIGEISKFQSLNEVTSLLEMRQHPNWGIDRIRAKKAWDNQVTGKGVKVAVIDTGIANHDDLSITGGKSFVSYTTSYQDDNGHGTHVAGIIANINSRVLGVAPDVELYAVKVLDSRGYGDLSDIIAGVDWAIDNNMDIVNLSLGSLERSPTLDKLFGKGVDQGIVFVAAAGNNGDKDIEDTTTYPAQSYYYVIPVAASTILDTRASFSSYSMNVKVLAPGSEIVSTYKDNGYALSSGTSMAAPHVSGVLALWKQLYPYATSRELRGKVERNLLNIGRYNLLQAPFFDQQDIDFIEYQMTHQQHDASNKYFLPIGTQGIWINEVDNEIYVFTIRDRVYVLDKNTLELKEKVKLDIPNTLGIMNYNYNWNTTNFYFDSKERKLFMNLREEIIIIDRETMKIVHVHKIPGAMNLKVYNDKLYIEKKNRFYPTPKKDYRNQELEVLNIKTSQMEEKVRLIEYYDFVFYDNKIYYSTNTRNKQSIYVYNLITKTNEIYMEGDFYRALLGINEQEGILYVAVDMLDPKLAIDIKTKKIVSQNNDPNIPSFPGTQRMIWHGDNVFYGGKIFDGNDLSVIKGDYGFEIYSISDNYIISRHSGMRVIDAKSMQKIKRFNAQPKLITQSNNFLYFQDNKNHLYRLQLSDTAESIAQNYGFSYTSSLLSSYRMVDLMYSFHWANAELRDFIHADLLKGYKDSKGEYKVFPNQSITRAEFTALLLRALDLTKNHEGDIGRFQDINPNDWFYETIQVASSQGLVHGVTENAFKPDRPITRAEIATMIVRAFSETVMFEGQSKNLSDIATHWGNEHIIKASSAGIVSGYRDQTFKPDQNASRAEAVVMLHRALYKEQTKAITEYEAINAVAQYEWERINLYNRNQSEGLIPLNNRKTTGYYQAHINQYDYSMFYWNKVAKPKEDKNYELPFMEFSFKGIPDVSNRFAKVYVSVGVSLEYDQFANPVTQFRDGTFSVKRMPDGSLKIYDYVPKRREF